MTVKRSTLAKNLATLRRIEEHRTEQGERELRRLFKELLKELREFLGVEYATLAENDKLTWDVLQRKGQAARFLEEFERRINNLTPAVSAEIKKLVEEMYTLSYEGMVNAVENTRSLEELQEKLSDIKLVSPDVLRAAVENPISGLTLTDNLEKKRKEIIYNIKRDITNGLLNGDRMTTMAKRIAKSVDDNYTKSVLIARTEVGRVREAGHLDATKELNEILKQGTSGLQFCKIWRTKLDSRVRNKRNANHRKMHGVAIPLDDYFDLGGGVKTLAPHQSGVARHDCNCRCRLSYELRKI